MDDVLVNIILNNKGYLGPMEKIKESVVDFEKKTKSNQETVNKTQKNISDTISKEGKKVEESLKRQSNSAVEAVKGYELFGVSINKVKEKISSYLEKLRDTGKAIKDNTQLTEGQSKLIGTLSTKLGGGAQAFTLLARGAKIFAGALLATGIGAIITVLGGLITMLTKTERGMDFLANKTAYVGGAMNTLIDEVSKVGDSFIKTFSEEGVGAGLKKVGDLIKDQLTNRLSASFGLLKEIFTLGKAEGSVLGKLGQLITGVDEKKLTDVANEMDRVGKASENIEKGLRSVRRQQAANEVDFAKTRAEIERLKKIGDDTTSAISSRINAVSKGGKLEQAILANKTKLLQEQLDLEKQRLSLPNQNNDGNREALYATELKIAELKNDSIGKQTELQNTLNGLVKENLEKFNQAKQSLKDIALEYKVITEDDQKKLLAEETIKRLRDFKTELLEANKIIKSDLTKEFEILDNSIKAVERSLDNISPPELLPTVKRKDIEALEKEIKALELTELNLQIDTSLEREKLKEKIKAIMNAPFSIPIPKVEMKPAEAVLLPPDKFTYDDFINFIDGIEDFEGLLNEAVEGIFKDNSEVAKGFVDGLATFVGEFGSLLNEATDLQLQQLDKQLEGLNERREKLEEGLDYERELYEKGLANNLSIKQEEVDLIIAEQERLNAQKEKLEKEAQRRQILSDSATQASALVTSSIQIIKGFAPLGPIGLGLGIAAVASLLAFFTRLKIQAYQATKLETGTGTGKIQDFFGKIDPNGDTDRNGQKGYRVVNARTGHDTGVIISARETLLPEFIGDKYKDIIAGMYLGKEFIPKDEYKVDKVIMKNHEKTTIIKGKDGRRLQAVPFNVNGKQGAVFIDMSNVRAGDKIYFE